MNQNSGPSDNRIICNNGQIPKLLNDGIEHSKAGRFDEAMKCFQQVLQDNPKNADALHLSGLVAIHTKEPQKAKNLIKQAIAIRPDKALYHFNLGKVLLDEGHTALAMNSYHEALRLHPSDTDALSNLASACEKRYIEAIDFFNNKKLKAADSACEQILHFHPEWAKAWHLWGLVSYAIGDTEIGVERIVRAINIASEEAVYHNSLGTILGRQGQNEYAAECFARAIKLDENYIDARVNLARAFSASGKLEPAIDLLHKIILRDPVNASAHLILASVLRRCGKSDEALAAARQAVKSEPTNAQAYGTLAGLLREMDLTTEAIDACRNSLELDPNIPDTHNILSGSLKNMGRLEESFASLKQALKLDPSRADIHSNYLFDLHYIDPMDAQVIFDEHREWSRCHSALACSRVSLKINNKDPNTRLRIGYISADLRSHSVAYFFEPLLDARDAEKFEVFCYSNNEKNDSTTARIRRLSDNWRDIRALDDAKAAALISSDAIDILIDLSGHSGYNRIPLFTHKPAPIQVTYIGYPNTTGIDEMDYRFTDEWADPPGLTEKYYTEQLVRLNGGFLCYKPPPKCPNVSPSPVDKNNYITFGSFNNLPKISPTVLQYWASILKEVSNSRLMLKSRGLKDANELIIKKFTSYGIEPERIDLFNLIPSIQDHLALYSKLDIALDTYPYNGTTTTCEALWMGVPVITLAGPLHVSRVGASLLHSAGLSDMIADNPEDYVQKAVELVNNKQRLKELRSSLRELLRSSPLTDAKRITSSVESAYRQMWSNYCSTLKKDVVEK